MTSQQPKDDAEGTQNSEGAKSSGYSRMTLELPVAELERIKTYARDKGVTAKYIMQRALNMYFERVVEKEGGKYKIEPIDNRDIL